MLLIFRALNQIPRIWEALRDNFSKIIAWIILLISGGAFALLLCWAFVAPDGETIQLRVMSADASGVFGWLAALWVSAIVALISYGYIKKHNK